jgi:hypothetical protein
MSFFEVSRIGFDPAFGSGIPRLIAFFKASCAAGSYPVVADKGLNLLCGLAFIKSPVKKAGKLFNAGIFIMLADKGPVLPGVNPGAVQDNAFAIWAAAGDLIYDVAAPI